MANYLNEKIYDNFSVTDNDDSLVPGLKQSDFRYHIFNPTNQELSSVITVTINELGFGHYRVNFLPNEIGNWYLIIYHDIFFPWGKAASYSVDKKLNNRVKP